MKTSPTTFLLAALLVMVAACACGGGNRDGTVAPNASPTATLTRPLATAAPSPTPSESAPVEVRFDEQLAYESLLAQMAFGPRTPGSDAHEQTGDYILEELQRLGWAVEEQTYEIATVPGRNIIGRANHGAGPIIILGAHYDSRVIADRSPGTNQPVPGAVDGASGVAVLLELARSLDLERVEHGIWLAFFDLEDQGSGGLPGMGYAEGARYMADNLEVRPEAVVVVDMIGDADQQIFYEGNSDLALSAEIWNVAAGLGFGAYFIPELGYTVIDDHLPFAERGITAVDIIDFQYAYWHTVDDTADKASAASLGRVGRTLETWLETKGDR